MIAMKILQTEHIEENELLQLIELQEHFPYDYIRGISKDKFIAYLFSNIKKALIKEGIAFASYDNRRLNGLLILQPLKWDSEIFGFSCARIKYLLSDESETSYEIKKSLVSFTQTWAKEQGFQFVDISLLPLDLTGIDAITENSFHLIATHIHHVWDFRKKFTLSREVTNSIRIATLADMHYLEQLAEEFIPAHNRFLLDKKIKETGKVPLFFREWLKNSLLGRARCVLVAEDSNQLIGYTTITVDEESKSTLGIVIGDVELTGVLRSHQSKGVYLDMITMAVRWAQKNNIDIMEGVIHISNSAANVVPPRLNANMIGAHHNFHWHAD